MANTGYQISPTVRQYFTSGANSGSVVTSSFDVNLSVSPFSASLNGDDFFNRSYDPIDCEPGFENCLVPLLTSLNTGSRRGRFDVSYVTQSSTNTPTRITASISDDINFASGRTEILSQSIGTSFSVTSSFITGTVFFRAFTSCSGPTPSPNSDLLSFTYDLLPPPLSAGSVNVIFKNNLSSAMEVEIRSTRGNVNYRIEAGASITYDYSTSPDPGAWTSDGRSEDLSINIKGGSKSTYGNFVQRTTTGIEKETYTTEGGFNNPNNNTDDSSAFTPDKGLTFKIRQLVLPKNGTTTNTTFTLLTKSPPPPTPTPDPEPDPGPGSPPAPTTYVKTIFGSSPRDTQDSVCAITGVDYKERTYFGTNGYLYNSREDALDDTKAVFPSTVNYILTSPTVYLIVNQDGYIQNRGGCILPSLDIYTLRGAFPNQESACKRTRTSSGSENIKFKDNRLISSRLSGRYPLFNGTQEKGGRNVILSSGRIIAYETCGTELTDVQYGSIGFNNEVYPLQSPENINPRTLQKLICGNLLETYSLGPSGIIYYGFNYKGGKYKYVPLGGSTGRWFKTTTGTFVRIQTGIIIDEADPC